jgi:hypothetical protein
MFKNTGWTLTHLIQAPMSSERFNGGVVSAMQKKKILGGRQPVCDVFKIS